MQAELYQLSSFFVSLFVCVEDSATPRHTASEITLGTESQGDGIGWPGDNFSMQQHHKLPRFTDRGWSPELLEASAGSMKQLWCVHTHIQTLLNNFFVPKTSVHTQRTGNSLAFAKTQAEIAVMLRFPDSLSTPLILACTMFSSGRGKAVSKRKGWQKILYVFSRLVANSCICEVTGRAMSLALGSKKPLKSHQVTEQRCGGSLILSRHDS